MMYSDATNRLRLRIAITTARPEYENWTSPENVSRYPLYFFVRKLTQRSKRRSGCKTSPLSTTQPQPQSSIPRIPTSLTTSLPSLAEDRVYLSAVQICRSSRPLDFSTFPLRKIRELSNRSLERTKEKLRSRKQVDSTHWRERSRDLSPSL